MLTHTLLFGLMSMARGNILDDVKGGFEGLGKLTIDGFNGLGGLTMDFGGLAESGFDEFGDAMFKGFGEIGDFFSEDFADFFSDDFAGFFSEDVAGFGSTVVNFFGDDVADFFTDEVADFFTEDIKEVGEDTAHFFAVDLPESINLQALFWRAVWSAFTKAVEAAANKVADGVLEAYEWTRDKLEIAGCVVEGVFGEDCTACIKDACNKGLSEVLPAPDGIPPLTNMEVMELAVTTAAKDKDGKIETIIENCANAMEACPALHVCMQLNNIEGDDLRQFLWAKIAECNLCYKCLPYGSTPEGCQEVLDVAMPNNCENCSDGQRQMHSSFLTCSGLKTVVEGVKTIAETLSAKAGFEPFDETCSGCKDCSRYEEELETTCALWEEVKAEWDFTAPVVPAILIPPSADTPAPVVTPAPVDPPTPAPVASSWKSCAIHRPNAMVTSGKQAGQPTTAADDCECAAVCDARKKAKAWTFNAKTQRCRCYKKIKKAKCMGGDWFEYAGATGFLTAKVKGMKKVPMPKDCYNDLFIENDPDFSIEMRNFLRDWEAGKYGDLRELFDETDPGFEEQP